MLVQLCEDMTDLGVGHRIAWSSVLRYGHRVCVYVCVSQPWWLCQGEDDCLPFVWMVFLFTFLVVCQTGGFAAFRKQDRCFSVLMRLRIWGASDCMSILNIFFMKAALLFSVSSFFYLASSLRPNAHCRYQVDSGMEGQGRPFPNTESSACSYRNFLVPLALMSCHGIPSTLFSRASLPPS